MKTIAFIAGSGLAQGLEGVLENVQYFKNSNNMFGIVLSYYVGEHKNTRVIILPRHGDSKETPQRSPAELVKEKGYEANIWQLFTLGVEEAYGLSAVGSLELDLPLASEGSFVLPNTYGRGFAASQHSFGSLAKTIHTPMGESFSPVLIDRTASIIQKLGYESHNGIYIYNGGDTFESPAEIRALDRLYGGEANRIVGMTTVPELLLLKQMDIPFAAICSNVNYAEGLSQKTMVSHEQTLSVMGRAEEHIKKIVKEIILSYD